MRTPTERFPVWVFIEDELQARGWALDDLCERIGPHVDSATLPDQDMTSALADDLSRVFGTSPVLWLNLAAQPCPA